MLRVFTCPLLFDDLLDIKITVWKRHEVQPERWRHNSQYCFQVCVHNFFFFFFFCTRGHNQRRKITAPHKKVLSGNSLSHYIHSALSPVMPCRLCILIRLKPPYTQITASYVHKRSMNITNKDMIQLDNTNKNIFGVFIYFFKRYTKLLFRNRIATKLVAVIDVCWLVVTVEHIIQINPISLLASLCPPLASLFLPLTLSH